MRDRVMRSPIPGRASRAFTLIELVAVVAIVGVLAVSAGPSLANLESTRQDLHAARVQRVLRFAQLTAMSSNLDTWVAFDTSTDTVTAYVEDANNLGKANRLALGDPLGREDLVLDLDSGLGFSAVSMNSTSEVQFDQDGVPYDSDGTELPSDGTVTMDGGEIVRITKTTGLVTID
jgi:prepilin-type N-terminal cleavage/methylation domain-containing protein